MSSPNNFSKPLVYVPVFNEEKTIGSVIEHIRCYIKDAEILIVDDGSEDTSAQIARSYNVHLICHDQNLGVGGALNTAIEFALLGQYSALLQLDGDGQHQLDEQLVNDLRMNSSAALIIGNRFHPGSEYQISRTRKLAIDLLSQILYRRFQLELRDPTSGFRFFRRDSLEALQNNIKFEYLQDTVLVIKKLALKGYKIAEVDSIFKPREHGESSIRRLNLVKAYLKTIWLLLF